MAGMQTVAEMIENYRGVDITDIEKQQEGCRTNFNPRLWI